MPSLSRYEISIVKVLFIGDRLFMKFPDFSYFQERLDETGGVVVSAEGMSDSRIVTEAQDASALVVIGRQITEEMIRSCRDCRLIMTLSVGYDVVDVVTATERKIPVSNCPLYCSEEVAEHALTLALMVTRKITELHRHVRDGGWDYKQAVPIHAFRTLSYGVFGLGRIGRHAARKATALGMNVVAYDPYVDDDIFRLMNVRRIYEFDDFLKQSDIITVHAPLTDETWHTFNADAFRLMKDTAVIVNTARGPVICVEDLEKALESRTIAGAGIDVLETEPPGGSERLFSLPTAVVTPHIAWYSEESHRQNLQDGMDELVRVLKGQRPRYIVNPQIYSRR